MLNFVQGFLLLFLAVILMILFLRALSFPSFIKCFAFVHPIICPSNTIIISEYLLSRIGKARFFTAILYGMIVNNFCFDVFISTKNQFCPNWNFCHIKIKFLSDLSSFYECLLVFFVF